MIFLALDDISISFDRLDSWLWVAILVLLALVAAFIFFFVQNGNEAKYKTTRDDKANSVRVFVIDYPKQLVTFFNVITRRRGAGRLDRLDLQAIGTQFRGGELPRD